MRYFSVVGVLPSVDGGRHVPQLGEAAEVLVWEATQCTAVERASSKVYFSVVYFCIFHW